MSHRRSWFLILLMASSLGVVSVLMSGCGYEAPPASQAQASKLTFTVQPSNVAAGGSITPAVKVTLQDASGYTVTTATNSVTIAIGTNPKIRRPSNIHRLSSGGFEWERRRSGIIHIGLGTRWRGPEEVWAGERGILYGHLHVHCFFPTMVIEAPSGRVLVVIDKGHLAVLDDPEVRDLASKYGDPDTILNTEWGPRVPGIDAPGSYEDYAQNPAHFIYGHEHDHDH